MRCSWNTVQEWGVRRAFWTEPVDVVRGRELASEESGDTAGAMPFKVLEEKEVPRRTPAPGSWEGAQRGRWELDDGRRR